MALPGGDPSANLPDNAPGSDRAPAAITVPLPHAALVRLPQIRDESRLALRQAVFLTRCVPAAGLLLAMGTVVALAGGGALAPAFAWSVLVLLGIGAILHSHLRWSAASLAQDLAGSAADMRAILFYMGFAWGTGAFLALSPQPAPAVLFAFAALPFLVFALLLGDAAGVLAFSMPVTLLTAIAALIRAGSLADAGAILLLQAALAAFLFKNRVREGIAPAGLALR